MINTVSMVFSIAMQMTGFRHSTTCCEMEFRYIGTRANDEGMSCINAILFRHLRFGFPHSRNINSVPLVSIVLLATGNVVKHAFCNAAIGYLVWPFKAASAVFNRASTSLFYVYRSSTTEYYSNPIQLRLSFIIYAPKYFWFNIVTLS